MQMRESSPAAASVQVVGQHRGVEQDSGSSTDLSSILDYSTEGLG